MKSAIVTLALVLGSSMAFAQGGAPAGAPAAEPSATSTKMSKKEAKAACKTEGKKGKDLKSCIKEKTM